MQRIYLFAMLCLLLPAAFAASDTASELNSYKVLCYHNVMDNPMDHPEKYTVSTEALAQQFAWLQEQGYTVISIDDLIASKKTGKPLPDKAVMLTFDDGYRSFYTHVFPLLKAFNYPAVFGLVGSWLELKPGEKAQYPGQNYTRETFLSADEIKEISASGLVEFASHSFDLHHGITANPQGNKLPAAVSRAYDEKSGAYESDVEFEARIRTDLSKNSAVIERLTGKRPRVMVWPYGIYNKTSVAVAQSLGMPINFKLIGGDNHVYGDKQNGNYLLQPSYALGGRKGESGDPLKMISRIIVEFDYSIWRMSEDLSVPAQAAPERVIHVDIDNIYDEDPVRQNENLGKLLERVKRMKVSTVYLQAYADPDGNGAADSVYFPNRHLPVRADLFGRVSWQLRTRAGVKVYAWMPLLAYELPPDQPLAAHLVESNNNQVAKDRYPRLTPYDPKVRQLISEIYEDLAKSTLFDGILFHDDATLDDDEDVSTWALDYYSKAWGVPKSRPEILEAIRNDPDLFNKWTQHKTRFLTEFSLELADRVRHYQPALKTARNLYAEVVLNADAEEWFAQSLADFLRSYDYTAVMAMPYMENADIESADTGNDGQPMTWLKNLVSEIAKQPGALRKTVFELQSLDWRNATRIDSDEMAEQMKLLQLQGALNFGYYPDDFLNDAPSHHVIRPFLSLQDFPFTKH